MSIEMCFVISNYIEKYEMLASCEDMLVKHLSGGNNVNIMVYN